MCDPRVRGALLFRCMVAELYWHFSNFPWLCKVFLQTFLHFASQFCNLKVISKLGGDFAALSKFGDHFAEKWHVHRPFFEAWSIFAAILKLGDHFASISKLKSDFAAVSQLQNEGNYAAKWHSCAKKWFRSCETPFQMASRLRNSRSALRACL